MLRGRRNGLLWLLMVAILVTAASLSNNLTGKYVFKLRKVISITGHRPCCNRLSIEEDFIFCFSGCSLSLSKERQNLWDNCTKWTVLLQDALRLICFPWLEVGGLVWRVAKWSSDWQIANLAGMIVASGRKNDPGKGSSCTGQLITFRCFEKYIKKNLLVRGLPVWPGHQSHKILTQSQMSSQVASPVLYGC